MIKHKDLGRITIHHLIPKERLKLFYGTTFNIPNNKIRLWRLRHESWHILFGNKTLNEIIKYLYKKKKNILGYAGQEWKILFKEKTPKQARLLLIRLKRIIRKEYRHLEFEKNLRSKIILIHKKTNNRIYPMLYLLKKFGRA